MIEVCGSGQLAAKRDDVWRRGDVDPLLGQDCMGARRRLGNSGLWIYIYGHLNIFVQKQMFEFMGANEHGALQLRFGCVYVRRSLEDAVYSPDARPRVYSAM